MGCSCCGPATNPIGDAPPPGPQIQPEASAEDTPQSGDPVNSVAVGAGLDNGVRQIADADEAAGGASKDNVDSAPAVTCDDGCCGSGEADAGCADTTSHDNIDACNDGCCEDEASVHDNVGPGVAACVDSCCGGNAAETTCNDNASSADSCNDGCCGEASVKTVKPENSCADGCCQNESSKTTNPADDCADACCQDKSLTKDSKPADDCADACCQGESTTNKSTPADACADACCQEEPAENNKPTGACGDSCCDDDASSVGPGVSEDASVMSCCRGKPSPCCDETCLDRLALRECGDGSRTSCDEKMQDDCCKPSTASGCAKSKRVACDSHRRSIRQKYAAKLEALGCICRALLALGQESCCPPRRPSSLRAKKCSKKPSKQSISRLSVDSCCAKGAAKCNSSTQPRMGEKKPGVNVPVTNVRDIERQASGTEHVVLSISGMTCTGCETKLNRTLATVAGVSKVKTSLVLSRAEFDVNHELCTVDYVMKHLERTTEFKCEIITGKGSTVDLLVGGGASDFTNQQWPEGILDMTVISKDTVRVVFDPEVVGARDLIEGHWRDEAKLAPICFDTALAAGSKHVRHVGLMTLLSAVLTIPVLVMAWAPLVKREVAYGSASLALATIVQLFIAGPFYPKALKALVFSQVIEMDLLIVLSTSAAYIFSVVSFGYLIAGEPLSTGEFFETSTLLVTLIMVGRYVAALARQKAVESISIRSLQTSTALLLVDGLLDSTNVREVDARLLQYGDFFKSLPDSKIPTDGTVISGASEVDESMLTGESCPVDKRPKSRVIAGTINGSGTLVVRLTRLPGDNTINTIAAMVDEAKLSKPKMQELADKVASYFVPVVIGLTIITFVAWVIVGVKGQGKTGSEATVQAITYAITVLIVSCPCAIGLAVPMVVVIVSGIAAERGVIFKTADAIETAYRTSHVVLDKTGTLTEGKLTVSAEHRISTDDSALSLLLGVIGESKHPVSVSVASHLRSKGIIATHIVGVKSLTGKGVEAIFAGQTLRAGNSRWLEASGQPIVSSVLSNGQTAFCFSIDGKLAAVFGLEDSLRTDAVGLVNNLQSRGVSVHIVSGDDDGAVQSVAIQLGIPASNVRSRSSPGDKQVYIKNLLGDASDKKKPIVVFCGDGTNDAVALAQATIGVHMNEGSDVAQSAADVVLLRPNLSGILTMIDASKASVRRIKFNFGWSFVYNTFAVLLAAGAFVLTRIPPEFAGLGELVSVLPVVAAAVLLRWSNI